MYAFVVFVGLALALAVVGEVLDEVLPVKAPKALTTTLSVGIAISCRVGPGLVGLPRFRSATS